MRADPEDFSDDGSEVLDNPQHEKFAQLVASGLDRTEAYHRISPEITRDSACTMGSKIFGIVCQRVRWIQEQSATKLTLTMQERREFLARAVRIHLHKLDLEKDGDLIQEMRPNAFGVTLKLPGKRECIVTDAELAGEIPDKPGPTINLTNQINIVTISEDRRRELIERKKAANERLRALKAQAKEAPKE
jgi:hypothetical protein